MDGEGKLRLDLVSYGNPSYQWLSFAGHVKLRRQAARQNKPLLTVDDPANAQLFDLGAEPITSC